MSIKKVILKVAEPRLADFGFTFDNMPDSGGWQFIKKVGEVEQRITFQKSNFVPNAIRVIFESSVTIEPRDHYDFVSDKGRWLEYQDQKALENVILELTNIIIQYGIPYLDLVIIPDLKPDKHMSMELCQSASQRYKVFAEKYELNPNDESSIEVMEHILLNRKKEVETEDWDLILDAAAFYGECFRVNLGGRWEWNEEFSECCIKGLGGKKRRRALPLDWVARFWGKPEMKFYRLTYLYDIVKKYL